MVGNWTAQQPKRHDDKKKWEIPEGSKEAESRGKEASNRDREK